MTWLLWLVITALALTLPLDSWVLAGTKLALALTALMMLFALLA